jgi:hypothetical protein
VVQISSFIKTKNTSYVLSNLPTSCKTAELLNVYFAGAATDTGYSTEAVRLALQKDEERVMTVL